MNIKLYNKEVYGRVLHYPACPVSKNLVKLTGAKTFNETSLGYLKEAGYEISFVDSVEEVEAP